MRKRQEFKPLYIRVTSFIYEKIEKIAKEEGKSVTQIAREAIYFHIWKREKQNAFKYFLKTLEEK